MKYSGETVFAVDELPSGLVSALRSMGYSRRDIGVKFAESSRLGSHTCFEGNRSESVLVHLTTGAKTRTAQGSWGGSNVFVRTRVDDDDTDYPIPPDVALVQGERGGRGGKSGYFHVVMHPSHQAALLPDPAGVEISEKEGIALSALCGLNSKGRTEARRRHDLTDGHFDGLVSKGLAQVNKAGHFRATTEGKRLADSDERVPRYV